MDSIPCPNCSDINNHRIHLMVGVYSHYITNPVEVAGLPPTKSLLIEYHCDGCGAKAQAWKEVRFLTLG